MRSGYRHLTRHDRCQIQALRKSGLSQRAVAAEAGRSQSTVSRGISRNSGQRGYRHGQADGLAVARRRAASAVLRRMTPAHWKAVEEYLDLRWSPSQTPNQLAVGGRVRVSATWIYRRIWADRAAGGDLYLCLRHRGKRRNRRGRNGAGRGVIPGRVDISERPAIVEEKVRVGDWEVDTIVGARHSGAIVSLVDRASKFTYLQPVDRRTAAEVGAAMIDCLGPVSDLTLTVTADNGREFAGHAEVPGALGADCCFARPYHSWERGLTGHTNGLVRDWFPKSTDFRKVDPADVQWVQDALNDRPRRVLGVRKPGDVFNEALAAARSKDPGAEAGPDPG